VPDEYLNAISAETTIAAAELCAAGMWRRVDGGYEVLDREMVEMAVNQFRKMDADREFCQATGGHEPMDEDPDLCRKCGAWRPTATDWPERARRRCYRTISVALDSSPPSMSCMR
jgi:hypothetical protein